MDAMTLTLSGVVVRAPVTVGTNLLIGAECAVCATLLRRAVTPHHLWRAFFVTMGIAAALGAVKHGVGASDAPRLHGVVQVGSNLAGGFAVAFAQWATLRGLGPARRRRRLERAVAWQLGLLVGAVAVLGSVVVTIVNAAVGLLPVLAVERRLARMGSRSARRISTGLAVVLLSGIAYALPIPTPVWMDGTDVAHVLIMTGLAFILTGARFRALEVSR